MTESAPITESDITLEITGVVFRGKGIARHEGCVVFVPGVLPGETVTARITKQRKSYAEADLVRIEKASPARITPSCPLADKCPGCSYQHMEYAEELRLKQLQFEDMLKRLGSVTASVYQEPTGSSSPMGYRNKIVLHVQKDRQKGTAVLGYFATDNKTVIDIPQCPLACGPINRLLTDKRNNNVFMRSLRNGDKVTFRYTEVNKALCWAGKTEPGKSRLTETTAHGKFQVHSRSFFQVNSEIANRLTQTVTDIIMLNKPETLIDLYCGVGVMSIAAAEAGVPAVLGIDYDRSGIRSAVQNAKERELHQVEFMAESAENGLKMALAPLDVDRCTLVVDPPRGGLEKEVLAAIAGKPPIRIVYVSCAADTLARDIALLAESGYRVNRTQLFDMFPRTPHFESVTLLNRV